MFYFILLTIQGIHPRTFDMSIEGSVVSVENYKPAKNKILNISLHIIVV